MIPTDMAPRLTLKKLLLIFPKIFFIRVTNKVKYTETLPPIILKTANNGKAYQFHFCTENGSNGVLSKLIMKSHETRAATAPLTISDFLAFREMTSIANKNTANGLTNKIATAAVTPAQISSRLNDNAAIFCL